MAYTRKPFPTHSGTDGHKSAVKQKKMMMKREMRSLAPKLSQKAKSIGAHESFHGKMQKSKSTGLRAAPQAKMQRTLTQKLKKKPETKMLEGTTIFGKTIPEIKSMIKKFGDKVNIGKKISKTKKSTGPRLSKKNLKKMTDFEKNRPLTKTTDESPAKQGSRKYDRKIRKAAKKTRKSQKALKKWQSEVGPIQGPEHAAKVWDTATESRQYRKAVRKGKKAEKKIRKAQKHSGFPKAVVEYDVRQENKK